MSKLVAQIDRRTDQGKQSAHRMAVRSMFSEIAETYDLLNHVLSFRIDRGWRVKAVRQLMREVSEGPVLDLCAGTLDGAVEILRQAPSREIVGVDFALPMLRKGKNKLSHEAIVISADAQNLPFRDESFAGIFCAFGMRNLSDPSYGLREAFRVLKPGGCLLVLEFFQPVCWYSRLFHAVYGQLILPLVGRLISGNREAYAYLAKSMRGFLTRKTFTQIVQAAGFETLKSSDLTLGIASIVLAKKVKSRA